MKNALRQGKRMIQDQINSTLELNARYSDYFAGTPTFVTYYHIDDQASREDSNLETVHSLIGKNSPTKYVKIRDVMVYGVDTLSLNQTITERGLNTEIESECILPPNSIKPFVGDFIEFDYDNLKGQLFRVKSFQVDKASPEKYFRIIFDLWQDNSDMIFGNTSKDMTMIDGKNKTIIAKTTEIVNSEKIQLAMDVVIDRYIDTFFDNYSNSFILIDDGNYWSPYLQQFIHKTKCLDKTKEDRFMNEIFVLPMNDVYYKDIYKQKMYYDSIFYAMERGDGNITSDMSFMGVDTFDLRMNRNLPYFLSDETFHLIQPLGRKFKWRSGNGKIFTTTSDYYTIEDFKTVDDYHKVHKLDDAHLLRLVPYLNDGDLLYHVPNDDNLPEGIYRIRFINDELVLIDLNLGTFFNDAGETRAPDEGQELFWYLREYVRGTLEMSDELLNFLYSLKCGSSIMNYIYIPILLHAVKQQIELNIVRG